MGALARQGIGGISAGRQESPGVMAGWVHSSANATTPLTCALRKPIMADFTLYFTTFKKNMEMLRT